LHRLLGRPAAARADIEQALALARRTGMAYFGPALLGTLARVIDAPTARAAALAGMDALLAVNHLAHNHLLGRRDAIEACLEAGDDDGVGHHTDALERFCPAQVVLWSSFFARRGRALARARRDGIDGDVRATFRGLAAEAESCGYLLALPELVAAMK
ncbi:MAG: hypothetical protein ABTQ27_04385, partial [Amaricoccus sp.]|uniref:hypothetical protein n=1 Tax=Amaricoccus sp. TaxID=1872485 RepID=UPI0033158695